MNKLFIKTVSLWSEPDGESDALEVLKAEFGGRAARRMTWLGMMMSHVLKAMPIEEDSCLVYATTYSETCAIEKYLRSFPYPSPQLFQTSIHPSGAEQYLIRAQKAVREFFPLAGEADLVIRALDCLALSPCPQQFLCGGEERGTWLLETGISSETNFAWALELTREPEAALGTIQWKRGSAFAGESNWLPRFFESLAGRTPLRLQGEDGDFELSWEA